VSLWKSTIELSRRFLWAESHQEIMDALAHHLKVTLGFPQVAIYSVKTEREPAVALLWHLRGDHPESDSLPLEGDEILAELLGGTEPVVVADAWTDPRTNKEVVAAKGCRTMVFLPMLLTDGSRFFLSTGTYGDERWQPDAESLDFLATLGCHTGLALDRLAISKEHVLLSTETVRTEKMELLGRMAGAGAHELRNLLTVISGNTALVAEMVPKNSEAGSQPLKIERAANRAIRVVKDVLAFSHKSSTKGEPLDLAAVLSDLRNVLTGLLGENVELVTECSPQLGPVLIRRDDFEQLLVQLVANAGEAMGDSGVVRIRLTQSGPRFAHEDQSDWICLTVHDSGPGLSPEVAERAFDPFFSTRPSARHSGLGLSACYGIIHQSGGHISVDTSPGQGATVKVMLPVATEPEAAQTPEFPKDTANHSADYSRALVRLCQDLLKARGFDEILEAGRTRIQEQLGLHSLFLYLAREDPPREVELWSFLGSLDALLVPQCFHVDHSLIARTVINSTTTVVVPDARTSPLTDKRITERLGSRTLLAVPFKLADGRRGALGTGTFGAQGVYHAGPDQLEFLEALSGLIVVALDRRRMLEEQRGMRRKLLRGRHLEAVSRLGRGLADDIRNALTAIDGFTHLTQVSLPSDHQAQIPLQKIEQASLRAAELLDKLVAFTRPEQPTVTVFDLNLLLHSLRPPLQHLVEDLNLEICTAAEPCSVEADWSQIEQVILNLVFNAKAASSAGSSITVSTEHDGQDIVLKVRDQGQGMSEEVRSMAFEPFFTTRAPGSGTGLGLPTCRGILTRSGGSISLQSSPSVGTDVTVRLPAVKENPTSELS
jgi:signal transduction histidine kinase